MINRKYNKRKVLYYTSANLAVYGTSRDRLVDSSVPQGSRVRIPWRR